MTTSVIARSHQLIARFSAGYHHLMTQRTAQRPADHHTGEYTYDHRQVQPTRASKPILRGAELEFIICIKNQRPPAEVTPAPSRGRPHTPSSAGGR